MSNDPHPCNDPNIGPIEFLQAIMHDDLFSYAIRMKAAKYLALIKAQAPQPDATILIRDPHGDRYLKQFPFLKAYMQ
jgi:hypothetical protein